MGPLLFSVYINDLPNASKFQTRLFADDTALFLSNDDLKTLNKDVNYELQWRLVTKMFGGAAKVLPYQRLGGFAPQTPLTKATPTL